MNSSDIKKKISKYQQKMENTKDSNKKKLYNQKITYYKSVQKGGDSSLLQSAIDKQQQEVLNQIEKLKSSFNSDAIIEQINEVSKSSSGMREQYDNLGREVRDTVGNYANSFKQIMDELSGFESANIDVAQIVNSVQIPGSIDELIIDSLAKDIISGKDVSGELELYGISSDDSNLTAAIAKLSGENSNQNSKNTNIGIPQTENEDVQLGTEESVVPNINQNTNQNTKQNNGMAGGYSFRNWL